MTIPIKQLSKFDEELDADQQQMVVTADDLERAKHVEKSWNTIQEDLEDLNDSMQTLASMIHTQQDSINVIEQNLTTTDDNVESGEKVLSKALKYSTGVYPIAGATIGGCIAGPLGLMVGLKAGAIATAVGGLIGFHGARILRKNQTSHIAEHNEEIDAQTLKSFEQDLSRNHRL